MAGVQCAHIDVRGGSGVGRYEVVLYSTCTLE